MEKLSKIFPGYRGYKNREILRETDRIVRESLHRSLKDSVVEQIRVIFGILAGEGHVFSSLAEQVAIKADMLAEKILHAEYGYEPLSSVSKIKEDELKKLISFDKNLASNIAEIIERVTFLKHRVVAQEFNGIRDDLVKINILLDQLETLFNTRKKAIIKIKF